MANFYVSHKRVKVLTGVFSCGSPASRFALSLQAGWHCRNPWKSEGSQPISIAIGTRQAGPNGPLPRSRERAAAVPVAVLEPGFEATGAAILPKDRRNHPRLWSQFYFER